MLYKSLNKISSQEYFNDAVINGIAQDKGLYFPSKINKLSKDFISNIQNLNNHEIAFNVIYQFIGNCIPKKDLMGIIEDTLNFDFPINKIEKNIFSFELFHGPSLAFKDVGARFMARCLAYFNRNSKEKFTVLVATSGDTGGAVANGFYKIKNVNVIILYPKGKISSIQEKQITNLGENITPIEVNGVFDDCQRMVKNVFIDDEINKIHKVTSANSINIARWLPQMFYYFFIYKKLYYKNTPIVVSVPSGNFGNICAGLLANKIGLPIDTYIASTNLNDSVPRFLNSGIYKPISTIKTISNAMDVGDPSNFVRIQKLYNNDLNKLKMNLFSYSFNDYETKESIKSVYIKSKYILDPHGAIGYLGLKEFFKRNNNFIGAFMETAHPIKFHETVEKLIHKKIPVPSQLSDIINTKKGDTINISNYDELKNYLLGTNY